jgi:Mrp family chromosome partitioning ATPase
VPEKSLQATLRSASATLDDLRSVKAALNGVTLGRSPRCYGVMPVASATGSTTVAYGLATLYALSGERVLLVDANFECPIISEDVGALSGPGLLQVIDDPDITERVIVQLTTSGLHVLPCGYMSGQTAPSDKLSSMQMAQTVGELRQSFGTIFFDLPPMTNTIDAEAIAHLLDGIILVASYDKTTIDALQKAYSAISRARGYIAGVLINNAPPTRSK